MANISYISEAEMQGYLETAKKRKFYAEQRRQKRLDQAWEVAHKAAKILYEQFGCSRVVVFGSLIHQELFHNYSDVDLAVWDVDESRFLQAVAAVTSLSSEIAVDLVAVEEISASLHQVIDKEGYCL